MTIQSLEAYKQPTKRYLDAHNLEKNTARFWSKVEKTDTCWLWTAGKTTGGYGQCQFMGKGRRVHQVAYELSKGPRTPGLVIDHLCRVRNCVNPDHLEEVTSGENSLRGISPFIMAMQRKECVRGHTYTKENTYMRGNCRWCTDCWKVVDREKAIRKKQMQEAYNG